MAGEIAAAIVANESIQTIKVISESTTNWSQFWVGLVIGSLALIFYLSLFFGDGIKSSLAKVKMRFLARKFKKNFLVIKHTDSGLFSTAMIERSTVEEVGKALIKFDGEPFDLILHTPGGEIFSTQFISRLFKEYPGKIRAIIPFYAMSGGTMLALSCDEMIMSRVGCLGPVDPQIGSLFRYGSAKAWDKIVKFKGKKADDQTISFAFMGKQYTESIKGYLNAMMKLDMTLENKKKFVDFLVAGDVEHGRPLTMADLQAFGVPVSHIKNKKFLEILAKLLLTKKGDGVHAITYKK